MSAAASFSGISAKLSQWFNQQGIEDLSLAASLFTQAELDSGEAAVVINADVGLEGQVEFEEFVEEVKQAFARARRLADRANGKFARKPMWDISSEHELKRMRAAEDKIERRLQAQSWTAKRSVVPPPAARPRYGTTRRARVIGSDSAEGRAQAERQERDRWVTELIDVLRSLNAPCLAAAEASTDPHRVVRLLVGGRRVSTLRARVREWRRISQWLRGSTGGPFFASAASFVDFLCDRLDHGGTKSALKSSFAAVRFIEDLVDMPLEERPSQQSIVINAIKELEAQAAARRDGREKQQAQPPPTEVIRKLEHLVVDITAPSYDRLLGWWICTSVWASLRFDDHRGLTPGAIGEHPDHYSFVLSRSKTTGPDKAQRLRPAVVSKDAWLADSSWFTVGWKLWQSLAPFDRDYYLCPPKPGGGCLHREIGYMEYSSRLRSLLASLEDQEGAPLGHDWAMFQSPHSFRSYLPSALDAIGAPRSVLSWLLSWKSQGSSGYARAGKTKTLVMQRTVANIIKAHLGMSDPIGEVTIMEHLRDHMARRSVPEEEVGRITRALSAFTDQPAKGVLWAAEASGDHQPSASTEVATVPRPSGSSTDPPPEADWTATDLQKVPEGYIVSISSKKRIRRLHLMGACHMMPGIDYTNYIVIGDQCPSNDQYDDYCRHCWRGDAQPRDEGAISNESQHSVGSATESSSTESDS